jgi:hypothetical protein
MLDETSVDAGSGWEGCWVSRRGEGDPNTPAHGPLPEACCVSRLPIGPGSRFFLCIPHSLKMFRPHHGKEDRMARKTIFVSDLTGKEIEEGQQATLTISYADARRGVVKLDVNANEVRDLASKGTKQARRGRKPKART